MISNNSMFQEYFVTLLFNVLRLLFVSFDSMFQDFSFLTQKKKKKLFAFPLTLFTSSFMYTCP